MIGKAFVESVGISRSGSVTLVAVWPVLCATNLKKLIKTRVTPFLDLQNHVRSDSVLQRRPGFLQLHK